MRTLTKTAMRLIRRNSKKAYFSLGIVSAILMSCSTTTAPGAIGLDRKQLMIVPAESVLEQSKIAYADTIKEAKGKGYLNPNSADVQRVRKIANRLIPQTKIFRPDAPSWKWEVNVIQSNELNAWCMAGGKIAFYSGIIHRLKLTDEEIAAIMGHEIAHALREHTREKWSQELLRQAAIAGVAVGFDWDANKVEAANMLSAATFTLPNSRSAETEADRMGAELMARAGYNPSAAVNVWIKMTRLEKDKGPSWLSTHPSSEDRITDLTEYAQKLQPIYLASKR